MTAKITSCSSRFRLTIAAALEKKWRKKFLRLPLTRIGHLTRASITRRQPLPPWLHFISTSVEETIDFAHEWARKLQPNDVVALVGDLGAGKTHFVKGLLQGLGSAEEATSPTFTLVHEYRRWPACRFFILIFTG